MYRGGYWFQVCLYVWKPLEIHTSPCLWILYSSISVVFTVCIKFVLSCGKKYALIFKRGFLPLVFIRLIDYINLYTSFSVISMSSVKCAVGCGWSYALIYSIVLPDFIVLFTILRFYFLWFGLCDFQYSFNCAVYIFILYGGIVELLW